jgi:fructose-bisphosphate aldolase, class I
MTFADIQSILGQEADSLLCHTPIISKDTLTLPNPNIVNTVFSYGDRNNQVLNNLQRLYSTGRLANTGYLSILPIDQGVEHSAGSSFVKNPLYFDPENIVRLAMEGNCSAVASTLGVLGLVSRKYAHNIPFIAKINHNQTLSHPVEFSQTQFAQVQQAWDMGAAGIGATIYFGSSDSNREILEISRAFHEAHRLGMFTVLWCYLRNDEFKKDGVDRHYSADLTGQANYLGVTIEADIIKQKLPTNTGGYREIDGMSQYGKLDPEIYTKLSTDHPIDLTRYQLINNFNGKIPLINSGDASGAQDEFDLVRSAVINKRAGGSGLIAGRKVFQKEFGEGVRLLHTIQDIYLCPEVTIS